MLSKQWKALWNPEMYHGWGKSKNYFEGWYCKMLDAKEEHALAVILGISYGENGDDHAFIQVLDGKFGKSEYHRFPVEAFKPAEDKFEVWLGTNFFSADKIILDLKDLKGTVLQKGITPWPKTWKAPGIMGWYSFVPFMECYHGVVSLHHTLEGELIYRGKAISMDGGIGYMEKDWGTSFPNSWIWMQTNHFEQEHICLMASVARIPWLGSSFIGFIAGILVDGKVHRFATYTGAKQLKTMVTDDAVEIILGNKKDRLHIKAKKGIVGELIFPISGQMTGKLNESIDATVEVELIKDNKLIFKGKGRNMGLEIGGNYEELVL